MDEIGIRYPDVRLVNLNIFDECRQLLFQPLHLDELGSVHVSTSPRPFLHFLGLGAPNRHHPVAQLSPSTKESSAHLPGNQLISDVTWQRLWTFLALVFSLYAMCLGQVRASLQSLGSNEIQNELKPNFVSFPVVCLSYFTFTLLHLNVL